MNEQNLIEMREVLDSHAVPEEDRCMHYLDLNGESVFLTRDTFITKEMYDVMPSWIKCLFVGVNDG